MCTPAVRLHLPPTARRHLLLRHQLRGLLLAQPPVRLNHQRQVQQGVQQDDLPPDQPNGLNNGLGTLGGGGIHAACTAQMEDPERGWTTMVISMCTHISIGGGTSDTIEVIGHASRVGTITFSYETVVEEQFGLQTGITGIVRMISCTFKTMVIGCSTGIIGVQFGIQARGGGKHVDAALF